MTDTRFLTGLVVGLMLAILFALLVTRGPAIVHAQSNSYDARIANALESIATSAKKCK